MTSTFSILKSNLVGLIQPLRGYAGMVNTMYPVPSHLMARSIQIAYQQEKFFSGPQTNKNYITLLANHIAAGFEAGSDDKEIRERWTNLINSTETKEILMAFAGIFISNFQNPKPTSFVDKLYRDIEFFERFNFSLEESKDLHRIFSALEKEPFLGINPLVFTMMKGGIAGYITKLENADLSHCREEIPASRHWVKVPVTQLPDPPGTPKIHIGKD